MDIDSKYLCGDTIQIGLLATLLVYLYHSTQQVVFPDVEQRELPDGTFEATNNVLFTAEEMLWAIAQIFFIGIGLGFIFIIVYFTMYLLRGCFRTRGESAHREIIATKAT